jgi:hypothetical protein
MRRERGGIQAANKYPNSKEGGARDATPFNMIADWA